MAKKYEHLLDTRPEGEILNPATQWYPFIYAGPKWGERSNLRMGMHIIPCPYVLEDTIMVHEFDQYLFLINLDATDPFAPLTGEFSITLGAGEEMETYIIDKPTVVFVPKGTPHGYAKATRVDKPFGFIDVCLTDNYVKKVIE